MLFTAMACGTDAKPTSTPGANPTPTPESTPTPTREAKIISGYESKIKEYRKQKNSGSYCHLDRTFKDTIATWTSNSVGYLRTYFDEPNLNATDVRSVVDYLENQRGRYERLCFIGRGGDLPTVSGAMDIKEHFDEGMREDTEDKPSPACEIESRLESFIYTLSSNHINYMRGFFDAPGLSLGDVQYLISHYESERGRYARACDGK